MAPVLPFGFSNIPPMDRNLSMPLRAGNHSFQVWAPYQKVTAAICLGTLLMILHHLGVIAAQLDPPAGYSALGYLNNLDVPQYLTWILATKTSIFAPNFHAPWITEPALFQPLMVLVARMPFQSLFSYYALHLVMYWLASFSLIEAGIVFCASPRQLRLAIVILLCETPLKMIVWAVGTLISPALAGAFSGGALDFSYYSADGLFRGGQSNSMTLTFGTAAMLAGFTLVAKYLTDPKPWILAGLLIVCSGSALIHPYEIFVLAPGAIISFLLYRKWGQAALVALASALGMAPHFFFLLRSTWLLDNSEGIHGTVNTLAWAPAVYGFPFLVLIGLMALRFSMPSASDRVLQIWFFATLLVPFIPGAPFAFHLFDGFAYCLAFLLARVASTDRQLRLLWEQRPVLAKGLAWGLVTVPVASVAVFLIQLASDGRAAEPKYFLSSVVKTKDVQLVEWVGHNLPAGKLILSPTAIAPWITAKGKHALASHDVMSITYIDQQKQVQSFYSGQPVFDSIARQYGVSYVVVPSGSPAQLPANRLRRMALLDGYEVLEVEGGGMKPYPGLVQLQPDFHHGGAKMAVLSKVRTAYHWLGLL